MGPTYELDTFKVHNVEQIQPLAEGEFEFPQDEGSDVEVLDEAALGIENY